MKRSFRNLSSARNGKITTRRTALSCAVALLCAHAMQQASASSTVYANYKNKPFFEFEILNTGETATAVPPSYNPTGEVEVAQREITADEVKGLEMAGKLWAEILGPGAVNSTPVKVQVIGYDESFANASAISFPNLDASGQSENVVGPVAQITSNENAQYPMYVQIGAGLDFAYIDYWYTQAIGDGFDYNATIFHEIGHALGISFFDDLNINYNNFLYAIRGVQYQPDRKQVLERFDLETGDPTVYDESVFLVGEGAQSGVYFKGEHVSEVLEGSSLIGIPINGTESDGTNTFFELSHFELERSMMSHQNYLYYTFFMEAELAAMQDLGYTIDRKNFYGRSIYADGQELINTQGFYARNDNGTAYLEGVANTATLGTGLHIYGSNNSVTQVANLLAGGAGGNGIRVDGMGNTVNIVSTVQVRADGSHGTGVLFAYGQNHTLNADGIITALGEDGVALRFDFGGNLLSDKIELRGSYIWYADDGSGNYRDYLSWKNSDGSWSVSTVDFADFEIINNGPLMDTVNISGTIASRSAAIYISNNALVQEINILPNAHIFGNIVSDWDVNNLYITGYVKDPNFGVDLTTALNFGSITNTYTTGQDFDLTLYGSIDGSKSFDMTLFDGRLTVLGYTKTLSLTNYSELTLLGRDANGYVLQTKNLDLKADSVLRLPNGAKALTDEANLDGSLTVMLPQAYYYNGESTEASVTLESSNTINGAFADTQLELQSPTLDFVNETLQEVSTANGVNFITSAEVSRKADAYAQYADTSASASTGYALVHLATISDSPYKNLITALDFSAPSGSEITRVLHSLSAESYNAVAQSSLRQLKTEDRQLSFNQWASPMPKHEGTYIYGDVIYSTFDSNGANWKSDGYSAMIGADTKLGSNITWGLSLTLSSLSNNPYGNNHASANAVSALIGVRALYRPNDTGFYLQGSLRAGVQEADLNRTVNIGSYRASMDSDWHSFIGTAQAIVGYDLLFSESSYSLRTGPFALAHYAFIHTPDIDESGNAALSVESNNYDSLPLELGWRALFERKVGINSILEVSTDVGYFYDMMDDKDSTDASFRDALAPSFTSELVRDGQNGAYLNLGAKLKLKNGFSAGLSLGSVTSSEHDGFNLSANAAYCF